MHIAALMLFTIMNKRIYLSIYDGVFSNFLLSTRRRGMRGEKANPDVSHVWNCTRHKSQVYFHLEWREYDNFV